MKLFVLALVLAFAGPAHAAPPKLEIVAKVVEKPPGIGYCGVIAWVAVLKYEVVRVEKGSYADKELFAVFTCPEVVNVGTVQRLQLVPAPKDGFIDKFPKGKPRFTIVDYKPVKP